MARIVCWHVHGSWTTSFVHGDHTYLIPTATEHDAFGRGRAGYPWPANAVEVAPADLADSDIDLVVLQRLEELALAEQWLRREPGRDVPAIYVEHDTPAGAVPDTRHPLADRNDITLVHVTHFNALMWDSGRAPTAVIEHGVPDPGRRYTGELPRLGAAINEPIRRWRTVGTDLIPRFTGLAPLDVFGIDSEPLAGKLGLAPGTLRGHGSLPFDVMFTELARRRIYLHPFRWTSLGLALIEAMMLGMPVVALGTTEAVEAVPAGAGVVSVNPGRLVAGARQLLSDPAAARAAGERARAGALARYGLRRFLSDWDALIHTVLR
jgi:Glycosyl transferases group 1